MTTIGVGVVCKNNPDIMVYLNRMSDGFPEKVEKELTDVFNSMKRNNLDIVDFCMEVQKRSCYEIDFGDYKEPYCPYEVTIIRCGDIEDYSYVFEFDDNSCSFESY